MTASHFAWQYPIRLVSAAMMLPLLALSYIPSTVTLAEAIVVRQSLPFYLALMCARPIVTVYISSFAVLLVNWTHVPVNHASMRSIALVCSIAATIPLTFVIILLGAHIWNFLGRTIAFAWYFSTLTMFPLFCVVNPLTTNEASWKELLSLQTAKVDKTQTSEHRSNIVNEEFAIRGMLSAFVGAWSCVIPLALDCDMAWQRWPLLPCLGALLAVSLAGMYSVVTSAVKGRKKSVDKSQAPKRVGYLEAARMGLRGQKP